MFKYKRNNFIGTSRNKILKFNAYFRIILTTFSLLISTHAHSNNISTNLSGFFEEISAIQNRALISNMPEEIIDPYNGTLNIIKEDIRVPGVNGLDIVVNRVHSSNAGNNVRNMGAWSIHMGRLTPNRCDSRPETKPTLVTYPTFETPKGSSKQFFYSRKSTDNRSHIWYSADHWTLVCNNYAPTSQIVVIDPNGIRYDFSGGTTNNRPNGCSSSSPTCYVGRIIDPNNNWIQIDYVKYNGGSGSYAGGGGNTNLKTITRSDGMKVDFTVEDLHPQDESQEGSHTLYCCFITSAKVKNPSGQTLRTIGYNYYPSGLGNPYLLKNTTLPDGSLSETYTYIPSNNKTKLLKTNSGALNNTQDHFRYGLQSIQYPQGGTVTYEYVMDCITRHCGLGYTEGFEDVVTGQERANIALYKKTVSGSRLISGTWNYRYQRGLNGFGGIIYDKTTVSLPESNATETYYHHSRGTALTDIDDFWKIGLLFKKTLSCAGCSATEENYTYVKGKKFNNHIHARHPTLFEVPRYASTPGIYAPRLTRQYGTIAGVSYDRVMTDFNDDINPHTIIETGVDSTQPNSPTQRRTLTYFPRHESFNPGTVTNKALNLVSLVKNEIINNSTNANRKIIRGFNDFAQLESINQYGSLTRYEYFTNGELRKLTDANNNVTYFDNYKRGVAQLTYENSGAINSGVQELATAKIKTYNNVDDLGQTKEIIDGEGNKTIYDYDALGRLKLIDFPQSGTANLIITWSADKRTQTFTRNGYYTRTHYDGVGREVSRELYRESSTKKLYLNKRYSPLGSLRFESAPEDQYLSSTQAITGKGTLYDPLFNRVIQQNTGVATIDYDYTIDGKTIKTDEVGNQFTYAYRTYGDPGQQQLRQISGPKGLLQTIGLNSLGQATTITLNGKSRTYQYGGTNNSHTFLTSETNPETGTTLYGRDSIGNMTSRTIGAEIATLYTYDNRNRLKLINYPSGTNDVTYDYFKNDNLKSLNNSHANISYQYDKNNSLKKETQVIQAKTYTIDYYYNSLGHLSDMRYPNGEVINFTPNNAGWPQTAGFYVSNVDYNAFGQPTTINYTNGRTFAQSYDSAERPKNTVVNDGITSRTRSYFSNNSLQSLIDHYHPRNTRKLTYDALDRLETAKGPWSALSNNLITYNLSDDIKSKKMGGRNLVYSYDNSNRLSSVSGLPNFIQTATYSYDNRGNITRKGNASEGWTYKYDGGSNLSSVNNLANTTLRRFEYSGDRLRVRGRKYELDGSLKEDRVYIHTQAGQLIAEDVKSGSAPDINYIYLGNRLVAEVEDTGAVSGNGIYGYGYGSSQHQFGYTHAFTLDDASENQRICVDAYAIGSNEIKVIVNGTFLQYLSSASNGSKICIDLPAEALNVGSNSIFFQNVAGGTWGIGNIQIQKKADITPILNYILKKKRVSDQSWETYLKKGQSVLLSALLSVAPAAHAQSLTLLSLQGKRVTYVHTDADGTPFAATNDQGKLEWRKENYPFGDKFSDTSTQRQSDLNFTGKAHDEEIGLSYFGARWYDPAAGRFTGIDAAPVQAGNWKTFNRYSYGFNNPYKYVDPDGNLPVILLAVLAVKAVDFALTAYDLHQAYEEGGVKGLAVEGGKTAAMSVVPGGKIASKAVSSVKDATNKGGTETVQRWMSKAELKATQETGLVRGGRDGVHYVTDAANSSAKRARQRTALNSTPEVRVTMEVPKGAFGSASKVQPKYGMPGGGTERTATGNISVTIKKVDGKP